MAPEVIDRLFEPFFTTKPAGKGTGMGLSVVHGIAKSHDGVISVESSPGKGTTFSLHFPIFEGEAAPEAAAPSASAAPRGNENVLLVDDDKPFLDFMAKALKELGYRVSAYAGSPEALEAFRARPQAYDLLITDYTMPHMTGLQLTHACHLVRPGLPVILCTGHGKLVTTDAARAEGICSIAHKPLDVAALGRLVRDALVRGGTS
jgi:CheY-like chemotaxis protein